jgi:putative nucleotidyltransferase with HDIG domain
MTVSIRGRLEVLLVGGSQLFVNQIRSILQRIRECNVEIGNDIQDALGILMRSKPDLVLSEWQVGSHTVRELLQAMQTSEAWKSIPVIVCLDEPSRELIEQMETINTVQILVKPLNQNVLSRIIAELESIQKPLEPDKQVYNDSSIRRKLKMIGRLAPLPTLVRKIMEILKNPNSSARDLAEEIKKDQVITARILKIVNSAYYGFHREISNVDHAIVVLGFDEVMNIAQAACLMNAFNFESDEYFNREKFWIHALGTAYIARALCRYTSKVESKDAFVVGLLHDFGKVILAQHFSSSFHDLIKLAVNQKRSLHLIGCEVAGIEHAEVGSLVAESWQLPVSLVNAIRYHHFPSQVLRNGDEVHLAHLANILCHRYNIGASGNPVIDDPDPVSLKALNIEVNRIEKIWETLDIDPDRMRRILR